MRKLLPILLALLGLGAGAGAGWALRPAPPEAEAALAPCGDTGSAAEAHAEPAAATAGEEGEEPTLEYAKLNNQFVVPILRGAEVRSLVILSISLEVRVGTTEAVYALEPKLRDQFLQVMFDHANMGGFDGIFTSENNMRLLRVALLNAARKTLGNNVSDVLISDIVRQDN